nr:hypothetical protein [Fodinicola feengrottensis]
MTSPEPAKKSPATPSASSARLVDDLGAQLVGPLADWLPAQRWFGSKGQEIAGVRPIRTYTLQDGEPQLEHLLVAVDQADGEHLSTSCWWGCAGACRNTWNTAGSGPCKDRTARRSRTTRCSTRTWPVGWSS